MLNKSDNRVKVNYDPMQELWVSQQETWGFGPFIVFWFAFYCFISSFIAVYTIKSLRTLITGKDSKSRQQTSPVLPIKGGKASTKHSVSGTTEAKRKSDPQDRKLH